MGADSATVQKLIAAEKNIKKTQVRFMTCGV